MSQIPIRNLVGTSRSVARLPFDIFVGPALWLAAIYVLIWGSAKLEIHASYLAEYSQGWLFSVLIAGSLLIGSVSGSLAALGNWLIRKRVFKAGIWLLIGGLSGAIAYSSGYIPIYSIVGDTKLRETTLVDALTSWVRFIHEETLFGVGYQNMSVSYEYAGVVPLATGGLVFLLATGLVTLLTSIRIRGPQR